MDHTEHGPIQIPEKLSAENSESKVSPQQFKEQLLKELETASPLDTFSILEQVEMYDEIDARQVIDDVYKEFESGENRVENIVVPVFTSIVDGLLQSLNPVKLKSDGPGNVTAQKTTVSQMQNMGLSATRIVQECRTFQYGATDVNSQIYSEATKNTIILENEPNINKELTQQGHNTIHAYYRTKDTAEKHGDEHYNYSFTGKQKASAMKRARDKDGNIRDAYTGEILHENTAEAQAAGDFAHRPEVDHVLPLARVHQQLRNNCLLTDEDVRHIANIDDNLVVTSQAINDKKKDKTNSEFTEQNKDSLNRETRRRMTELEKKAQKKINGEANKTVLHNMFDSEKSTAFKQELGNVAKDAAKSGVQMGIGNAILELLKPLYYEMADSFKNGFTQGVGVNKIGDAFKIRMGRIKNHLQSSLKGLGLGSLTDLIKGVITSIVSSIVDLFFGLVKNLLKLLQKGIPIVVSAFKILFDKTKSPAERGDAVVKLLGSSLIAILGGMLIEKIFPDNPTGFLLVLKSVCTCLLSGCGSLFFMLLMDKIDLFDAKAEKRQARIREIFDARREDMEQRVQCMQVEVIATLKKQRLYFDDLISGAEAAIEEKNVDAVVTYSYSLAAFFKVDLEYSNTQEFVKWWDQQQVVQI